MLAAIASHPPPSCSHAPFTSLFYAPRPQSMVQAEHGDSGHVGPCLAPTACSRESRGAQAWCSVVLVHALGLPANPISRGSPVQLGKRSLWGAWSTLAVALCLSLPAVEARSWSLGFLEEQGGCRLSPCLSFPFDLVQPVLVPAASLQQTVPVVPGRGTTW